jgi:L-ascorbate metabolism protein UlaG (beta-lactamase superfamily)
MHIEWYGQSAFRLTAGSTTVFIDPFADMTPMLGHGMRWDYPAIVDVAADLLLVTHEHPDHNGVEAIGGDPLTLRSTAGSHGSPIGEVVGIASEHDEVAGTQRGANVLFVFSLAGRRVAHLGDLGQRTLRDEQLTALGQVDILFVPVGGGPTIGAAQATGIGAALGAKVMVPMHYRTERIDFLEPVDAFAEQAARVERMPSPAIDLEALALEDGPVVVVPAAP